MRQIVWQRWLRRLSLSLMLVCLGVVSSWAADAVVSPFAEDFGRFCFQASDVDGVELLDRVSLQAAALKGTPGLTAVWVYWDASTLYQFSSPSSAILSRDETAIELSPLLMHNRSRSFAAIPICYILMTLALPELDGPFQILCQEVGVEVERPRTFRFTGTVRRVSCDRDIPFPPALSLEASPAAGGTPQP